MVSIHLWTATEWWNWTLSQTQTKLPQIHLYVVDGAQENKESCCIVLSQYYSAWGPGSLCERTCLKTWPIRMIIKLFEIIHHALSTFLSNFSPVLSVAPFLLPAQGLSISFCLFRSSSLLCYHLSYSSYPDIFSQYLPLHSQDLVRIKQLMKINELMLIRTDSSFSVTAQMFQTCPPSSSHNWCDQQGRISTLEIIFILSSFPAYSQPCPL